MSPSGCRSTQGTAEEGGSHWTMGAFAFRASRRAVHQGNHIADAAYHVVCGKKPAHAVMKHKEPTIFMVWLNYNGDY